MQITLSSTLRFFKCRCATITTLFGAHLFLLGQLPGGVQSVTTHQAIPLEAKVQIHNNRAQLFISNQPVLPMFYSLTDSPGGRWTWEEVPRRNIQIFSEIGVKQFCVSIWLEWIWTRPGHLDIDLVRHQIRGILDVCPDAAVMIRLHVNSPPWWNEQNPDELVRYADGPVEPIHPWGMVRPLEGDLERTPRHSMASLKWRKESGEIVAQLCRELAQTPEGDHLVAMHLAAGVFHEWHYYGFIDHEPDTGSAMTANFRHWLKEKYQTDDALRLAWKDESATIAAATVPGIPERQQTSDGYFRDPLRERRVIDYFECQQLSVVESIEHFCRITKENWPRPIVTGAFYGYYFTLFGRMTTGGHLQPERLLDSPWIDYLSGPQSYRHRDVGRAGFSRSLLASIRLHGKLWMDEYDTRPATGQQVDADPVRQLANSIGIERRCISEPLVNGQGFWFYDFGPRNNARGAWDQPSLLLQAKELKNLFEAQLTKPQETPADVLLVMSNDVFYYLGNSRTTDPMTPVAIDDFTEDLFHAGVAVDMIYLFDLARIDLSHYRAVILPNAYFLTEQQRQLIGERVARAGRHLIWMSAPGYTDGERLDVNLIGRTTGIRVERVGNQTAAQVEVRSATLPALQYGFTEKLITPLFAIDDHEAEPLGRLAGSNHIGLARKKLSDSIAWFSSVPLRDPGLIRSILRAAGAHIYQDAGDVTYAGNGLICLHTFEGGNRSITLRNGKTVSFTMQPKSTVLLDDKTGDRLLAEPDLVIPRGGRN